jgi:N4-gp56 family major capsid protein
MTTDSGVVSGNTITGGIPPAIQAYYDRLLLRRAVPAQVHGRFAQPRTVKMRSGNQIKFRRYESLPISTLPLQQGVSPTPGATTITELTATLSQYGYALEVTDMVTYTNQDPVLTEFAEMLGEQGGTTIDQVRRDTFNAGTNVTRAGFVAARNLVVATIDSLQLRTTIRTLGRGLGKYVKEQISGTTQVGTVPIRAAYCGIIHPDTEAELEQIAGYIPVAQYPNGMMPLEDECGTYRNIRFLRSTNAKVFADAGGAAGTMISTTGANADVYTTLIIAMDAVGVCPLQGHAMENIIKALGSGGTADPLNQRATSGWKATTTQVILNDAWMVRIEHTNRVNLV